MPLWIRRVLVRAQEGRRDGLAEELKAFVRDRLEPYKHPSEVIFVDSLPTTHLGKVDRGPLRAASSPSNA